MFRRYPRLCTALLLLGLIALGHGWSLRAGLFMDDHAHYQSLRDSDWSFRSAVESSRLGIVGDVLDVWNRGEKTLSFFRPIAFWTMKAEYTLVHFAPMPMHLFSLAWHFLVAMLVVELGRLCFGSDFLAALAGALFSVHPAHVANTYWIASQTELMVTAYLLAALLCYAGFSRWPVPFLGVSDPWRTAESPTRCRSRWLIPAMLFFVLALGCRESGLLLAPLVVIGDLLVRPKKLRWTAYAVITVIVVAYLILRFRAMQGFPLPAPPYLMRPTQPGFLGYISEKFMLYSLGLFAYVPVAPMGGMEDYRHTIWRLHVPFAGVVLGWVALLWFLRRRRGIVLLFAWLVLAMLPMLPVFTSPHHLYLPSVGMILLLVAALALGGGWFRTPFVPRRDARATGTAVVAVLHCIGFTVGCWGTGWLYRATWAIEKTAVAEVESTQRSIEDGHHLFFINLPLAAWFVVPAYENQNNARDLHGHALSFCPNLVVVEQPIRLTRVDDHTLRVETTGDSFFAGPTGEILREMLDFPRDFAELKTVDADLHDVELEHGPDGVRAMTFRFRKPLSDPSYHFYYGSQYHVAYPIDFEPAPRSSVTATGEDSH